MAYMQLIGPKCCNITRLIESPRYGISKIFVITSKILMDAVRNELENFIEAHEKLGI